MPPNYDDEVLPQTPADVATPFVLQPAARASSLFANPFYPSQDSTAVLGKAGELRGLYGTPGGLLWHPDWSEYRSARAGGNKHWGVDIYAPPGTNIVAVVAGDLSYAQQADGLGLYARLAITVNGNIYTFHYGHLSAQVGAARSVAKGEVIGRSGCSGNADNNQICSTPVPNKNFSSSHVHFALLPPQSAAAPKRSNPLTVLGWDVVVAPRPSGVPFVN